MRKNLLITTALVAVAFSLPARAETEVLAKENQILSGEYKNLVNNNKSYAGAMTIDYSTAGVTIADGTKFTGNENKAKTAGGALKVLNGITIGDNVEFSGNKSTTEGWGGGAMFVKLSDKENASENQEVKTGKVTFSNNEALNAAGLGGAIALEQGKLFIGSGSEFTENKAKKGGAIMVWKDAEHGDLPSALEAKETTFTKNEAQFGGAIYNGGGKVAVSGSEFKGNSATTGGAIYNEGHEVTITNSSFTGNTASKDSGAISQQKSTKLSLSNVSFNGNSAGWGGAMVARGTVDVTGGSFTGNHSEDGGGAIYLATLKDKGHQLSINGTMFKGNYTTGTGSDGGGAIGSFSDLVLKNASFTENHVDSKSSNGGGAIMFGSVSTNDITNTTFTSNTSKTNGGALTSRWNQGESNAAGKQVDGTIDIVGSTFTDNIAEEKGGAFYNTFYNDKAKNGYVTLDTSTFSKNSAKLGGAIYNEKGGNRDTHEGVIRISDSSFSGNIATEKGGAIYNAGTLIFAGATTFSGNKVGDDLNDIHNEGKLTVAKGATIELDGGISGAGTTKLEANTTLNVKQGVTTIANKVESDGTTLNVTLEKGAESLELKQIFTNEQNGSDLWENITLGDNALYNFVQAEEDASLFVAEQKSSADVASSLGVTGTTAAALLAATSTAESGNANFDKVSDVLHEAAQAGNSAAAKEAEKLGAEAAPIIHHNETNYHNMLFTVVNNELNGVDGAIAQGMSSGDFFHKAKAWIRGLFNKADYDGTSKARSFDADTYGFAMGLDKEIDNHFTAGFGYAYAQTDVDGDARDTDIDTNTLFVYGKYKPADWYINTTLAYSWSDYDEKKAVLGYNGNASYDVDTIVLQSMYGVEKKYGEYDVTPEFGFRYLHIEQDGYTDALGTKVSSKDSDILTAVAGTKVAKNYELDNGMVVRPELKAAVTYDVLTEDNNASVLLANGASYNVSGERMNRFGVELGARVATNVTEDWQLTAGYELKLREDYNDNTLMFDAKYSF